MLVAQKEKRKKARQAQTGDMVRAYFSKIKICVILFLGPAQSADIVKEMFVFVLSDVIVKRCAILQKFQ